MHYEFFIQLHLTERCNLRCTHCYQGGNRVDEMSLDEIRDLIGEVEGMIKSWSSSYDLKFSPSFTITGGEPFLRNDFFVVLDDLAARGIDTFVLTNGTLIGKDNARDLSRLGIRGVQVSVEGPREIHDQIRGEGSFSSALRGVRHLLDAGITVTLNMTLSSVNAGLFMEMVDLSKSLGVQRLGFSRLVPCGRGGVMAGSLLSKGEFRQLCERVDALHVDGLEIVSGDPVVSQISSLHAGCSGSSAESGPSGGCAAAFSGLTILPDGTITPCRRLPVPIGNVRRDSLQEVWATSEVLQRFRDRGSYRGRCGTCPRWSVCRGCRAIAYAYSHLQGQADYLAEDPQCFIES